MIKAYCFNQVKIGIQFLKIASDNGYVSSCYALGLILRDTCKKESVELLVQAASEGYLPALQELLPAKEMKEKYGEPSAEELGAYFDLVGLGHLLRRDYSNYPRCNNASHCWNPYCGRWAYKNEKNGDKSIGNRPLRPGSTLIPSRDGSTLQIHESGSDNFSSLAITKNQNSDGNTYCRLQPNRDLGALSFSSYRLSRMKMCSSCRRAKYCSKLCQVYDWRSGRHKKECRRI